MTMDKVSPSNSDLGLQQVLVGFQVLSTLLDRKWLVLKIGPNTSKEDVNEYWIGVFEFSMLTGRQNEAGFPFMAGGCGTLKHVVVAFVEAKLQTGHFESNRGIQQ
jgi:hypothetical protein